MEVELKESHIFNNRDLMALIFPLMVEQFLAVAVGLADSIMVASVGESAVSAVSLVDSVIILLINIFAALATGGAVVAGQYIGQQRLEKASESGDQLLVFVTFISVIIMALMYIGRGFILNVVFGNIDVDVANYAETYLLIVFSSIPFIALYSSGAALFRAMGNSKITMFVSFIMNAINVIGNVILIYGLHMGVEGAAIPTLVSRVVAALLIVGFLKNESILIHISKPFKYRYDKKMVRDILRIGIPNGVENSMFQLGKILLLSIVAGFGTASITANAVGNTIASFEILPGAAVGLGLITVVSRCVGAGDYEMARYYTKKLLKYTYISVIILNIGTILVLPYVLEIYNLSSETAAMAKQVIIFHSVNTCIIWPLSFTLPNTLRASNDVRYTMIVGVGSMWIFRIGFGILLAKYMGFGMFGVWVAMIIDWIARTIFFTIRYKGRRWETKTKI
ncbi:putative MATE family efflux protein [Sedimentibacter acidaminivorans]|uniref:Probable multidrug resistance protein NorM n=1 Tax=Sedimentibacter acidaminivorans TaxID=913099 RepID=A0ABS4G9D6_9FIRM|nr:MATE family efflux transporter [Sedimentibacter acidaminivorans]MBP1924276.1 putative MATE family efflux protein [Sedimentibacter acidaminivorans]